MSADQPGARAPVEAWAGVECSITRLGNHFYDQLQRSRHAEHPEDLEAFAALGLGTLRYPVLWERVAPDYPEQRDWSWPDERLARLRKLRLRPIVGLIHHGSGPAYTSLTEPSFA